jgi:hypothetical protein
MILLVLASPGLDITESYLLNLSEIELVTVWSRYKYIQGHHQPVKMLMKPRYPMPLDIGRLKECVSRARHWFAGPSCFAPFPQVGLVTDKSSLGGLHLVISSLLLS